MNTTRSLPQSALDAAFDSSTQYDASIWRAEWQRRNSIRSKSTGERTDVSYGASPAAKLDLFPCKTPDTAPTLVFFHGGFWMRNSKETFRFLTDGFHAAGFNVVFVGYTLAPKARMQAIVAEAIDSVNLLQKELPRLGLSNLPMLVAGWSAGAQLAALLIDHPGVGAGIGISGLYDLAPLSHTLMNETLRLDKREIERFSPILHVGQLERPFEVVYGDHELPRFREESRLFHAARSAASQPGEIVEMAGHHHSVLEHFMPPEGRLIPILRQLRQKLS